MARHARAGAPYAGRMTSRAAWGHGLATRTLDGTILDTWFPEPRLGAAPADAATDALLASLRELEGTDEARGTTRAVVTVEADLDAAPTDASDVYLRLHLLSHRLLAPHGVDLTGIFGLLANVVWTSAGPCSPEGFEATRLRLAARGPLTVYGVDKFPRMVDYVLPTGVRIADADRVRLGAHLAEGTTVMHEGFVNFNAGTLGHSMVEGRISAGVTVGEGSDIGGGASIMGTLSGGGTQVVTIGERSLLGANAGIGIPLGDDCVVEAGLYVTAGTKVTVVGATTPDGSPVTVKARELAGRNNLLLRRNSLTGAVEAVDRAGTGITLNAALHAN